MAPHKTFAARLPLGCIRVHLRLMVGVAYSEVTHGLVLYFFLKGF